MFPDEIWPVFPEPWPLSCVKPKSNSVISPVFTVFCWVAPFDSSLALVKTSKLHKKKEHQHLFTVFACSPVHEMNSFSLPHAKSETFFSALVCFSGHLLSVCHLSVSKFLLNLLSLPQRCSYLLQTAVLPRCVSVWMCCVFFFCVCGPCKTA